MDDKDKQIITIFIVEDHPIFTEGLVAKIENEDDMQVCGTARSVEIALPLIEKIPPKITITDISFKDGLSGIELIKALKKQYPFMYTLALSMHEETHYIERAIRAGANGYVTKSESSNTIIKAIRNIMNGQIYLNEKINTKLMTRIMHSQQNPVTDPVQKLTDREFEIFQLIAKGYNTLEIATSLDLSKSTIDVNRKNIREKLKITSNAELIHYAYDWTKNN